jgi:hypothetical protein
MPHAALRLRPGDRGSCRMVRHLRLQTARQVTVPPMPCLAAYPQGRKRPTDFGLPAESHRAAVVPRMGRFPVVIRESMIILPSVITGNEGSRSPDTPAQVVRMP